jgi:hypothetical protein
MPACRKKDVDESGWSEYRVPHDDQTPRKLSQGEMARLLRPFGIRPRPIWPAAKRRKGRSRRGYYRAQFESAWARYCAEGVTPSQPSHTSATVEPSQLSPAVTP